MKTRVRLLFNRFVVITLVALFTTVVTLYSIVSAHANDEPVTEGGVEPPTLFEFETVAEAQTLVPYEIRLPEWPAPLTMQRVIVEHVPVLTNPELLVTVDVLLVTPEGKPVALHLANYGAIPWGKYPQARERLRERTEVTIAGAPAIAATTDAGSGYLYWLANGVIYQLEYPEVRGIELVSVAQTLSVQ